MARWTPLLGAWLATHLNNKDPVAPPLAQCPQTSRRQRNRQESLYRILQKVFADADMPYPSPHWFRHSAATRDAENESAEICIDGIQPRREQGEGDKELASLALALKSLMQNQE